MVKAMIDINESANQLLNVIKAKYNFKTKSEAINKLAEEYAEKVLHHELKPEAPKRQIAF
ncbi:DUF2683 family protein [archaeon]|nr:DUF2683 family protein [archaeon]